MLLATACATDGGGGPSGVTRSDLLALARNDSGVAPPPVTIRTLSNKVLNTVTITHTDSVQTAFLEIQLPAKSVLFANGATVCDSCNYSISITLTPGGQYAFTIGPADLVFRLSSTPVVTVRYAAPFGDLSVYTQSPRYATPGEFDQALALWYERSPAKWVEGRNSSHTTATTIVSAIDEPGPHLIAALR